MRLFVATLFLLVSAVANAAVVDNGIYNTDSVSGLDWLDLPETAGLSMSAALVANQDWRLATNTEVENLFGTMFEGFYATEQRGRSFDNQDAYADQKEDVLNFISIFGITSSSSTATNSVGLYFDEDGFIRRTGVYMDDTPATSHETAISGLEETFEFSSYYENTPPSTLGTFLVRASVVPIPAAVWLFGSALAGVGLMRRKHTA